MSPSHANKLGVRYRYYVSQAILQQQRDKVGSVGRVPAAEIEKLVLEAIRRHHASEGEVKGAGEVADRDLIEQRVHEVTVKPQGIDVRLFATSHESDDACIRETDRSQLNVTTTLITLPWAAPGFIAVKGIVHSPNARAALKPESRDALLGAIARARRWIDDLRQGKVGSFAAIAKLEGQGERHIRLLAPLAFVSPRIISAIIDGTAPADLTVTGLAKALPHSWAEQDRSVGLH